jgi:hypothetical protein
MKNPTMVYRCPGQHVTDGIAYDYTIVDEDEVEAKLAEGWHRDWNAADAARRAAEEQLAENEAKLEEVEAKLADAGGAGDGETPADKPKLTAVHKGRGKWSVVDAEGNEIKSGLTKEEAAAAVA